MAAPEVTRDNVNDPEICAFYCGSPMAPEANLDLPPTDDRPILPGTGRAVVCELLSRPEGATYAEVWDALRDAGLTSWNTASKLNGTTPTNGLGMVRLHGFRLTYDGSTGKYRAVKSAPVTVTDRILALAQQLADQRPTSFERKGPGIGDDDTNTYMRELRELVERETGVDYSEKKICGDNALAVDFYIDHEETVIEIALSLRNPNCEFERDILKVLMAQEASSPVKRLILLAKPGGEKRVRQPSSQAMVAWAARNHNLEIIVRDLRDPGTATNETSTSIGQEEDPTASNI